MRAELLCVLSGLAVVGCAVGPKYHTPEAPVPADYKEWKVASPQEDVHRGQWWTVFSDPELDALHVELDASNQNIAQAYENYMAASALVRQAGAQRFPTVTTSPAVSRSHPSTGLAPGSVSSYVLPVDASWEPDLWGRIRNTVNQYRYAAQVSAADLENVRLSQHSTLAQLFFQVRGQDALRKVLDDTIAADTKIVNYARAQHDTGVGDRISLVEAEHALQAAEAIGVGIDFTRAQYEHAIAVLVGKPPAEFSLPQRALEAVPPDVPPGIPSELLERRPDIAAAERLMAQANAQLGVAHSAFYPNVLLSASAGFGSSSVVNWLSWPSRLWAIGASATQTIFDGGQRRATVQEFTAAYNADVASYRQTVLTAFQQVEDDLAAERMLADETQKQDQAVASAREFLRLATDRYQLGLDPYLNVLTAQTTLLAAEQTLVSLQTQRMTSIVQLIAALGGGWHSSQLAGA